MSATELSKKERRRWIQGFGGFALLMLLLATYSFWAPTASPEWEKEEGGMLPEEQEALRSFVEASMHGGLKAFDQEVQRFASGHRDAELSLDFQLYFVQGRLAPDSPDQEYFDRELKPAQETFRKTLEYGSPSQLEEAYGRLKSRVLNYELGASGQEESLGDGARAYLSSYKSSMGKAAPRSE